MIPLLFLESTVGHLSDYNKIKIIIIVCSFTKENKYP